MFARLWNTTADTCEAEQSVTAGRTSYFLLSPFLTLYPLILPELPEKKDIYYLIN